MSCIRSERSAHTPVRLMIEAPSPRRFRSFNGALVLLVPQRGTRLVVGFVKPGPGANDTPPGPERVAKRRPILPPPCTAAGLFACRSATPPRTGDAFISWHPALKGRATTRMPLCGIRPLKPACHGGVESPVTHDAEKISPQGGGGGAAESRSALVPILLGTPVSMVRKTCGMHTHPTLPTTLSRHLWGARASGPAAGRSRRREPIASSPDNTSRLFQEHPAPPRDKRPPPVEERRAPSSLTPPPAPAAGSSAASPPCTVLE